MRLVYTDAANDDLDEIYAYIAAESPRSAARLVNRLAVACRGLTSFPLSGRAAGAGVRELTTVPPYVIIYRVGSAEVFIDRIVHGARLR